MLASQPAHSTLISEIAAKCTGQLEYRFSGNARPSLTTVRVTSTQGNQVIKSNANSIAHA